MTTATWLTTAGTNDWTVAANWSLEPPGSADAAVFSSTTLSYTVTLSASASVGSLLGEALNATLAVVAGTLALGEGGSWGGAFDLAGGELAVSAGTLGLSGPVTLDGAVAGGGELELYDASGSLDAASLTVATLDLSSETLALTAGGTFAGALDEFSSTLELGGATLDLAGQSTIEGSVTASGGALSVTGTAYLTDLYLYGAVALLDSGVIVQDGYVETGYGSADAATIAIASGATYDMLSGDAYGYYSAPNLAFVDAGLLEKAGGDSESSIEGDLAVTPGGTLAVDRGTLYLEYGTSTIAGLVSGPGVLTIGYGATVALAANAVLDVGSLALTSGKLTLGGDASYAGGFLLDGTLDTGGNTLTLSGDGTLEGTVTGGGAVVLTGSADVGQLAFSGSGFELIDEGTVFQTGSLTGSVTGSGGDTISVAAGATWDVLGDFQDEAYNYTSDSYALTFQNAGQLEKIDTNSVSYFYGTFDNTGTLRIDRGTLDFQSGTATFGGTVAGAGELAIGYGETAALAADATLSVATLYVDGDLSIGADLTYGGAFQAVGGTIATGGDTLTLTGTADSLAGMLDGGGTLAVTGLAEDSGLTVGGTLTELLDQGTITQSTNNIQLGTAGGDSVTLAIASGATYALYNDVGIDASGTASIVNAGLLVKRGVNAGSTLEGALTNETGATLEIDRGYVALTYGDSTLDGTIDGAGQLYVAYAETATLSAGVDLTVGTLGIAQGADLVLGGDATYGGVFYGNGGATLNTQGHTLTLTGSTNSGAIYVTGGGVLAIDGTFDASGIEPAGTGSELLDQGDIVEVNYIQLGSSSADNTTLAIASGATYDLLADVNIGADGTATVSNAGLLEKTGANGQSVIYGAFTNAATATLAIDTGTVLLAGNDTLGGTVNGAGELALANGGTYTIAAGAAIDPGVVYLEDGASLVLAGDQTFSGDFFADYSSVLDLNGNTLTLAGTATERGYLVGPGTLAVTGTTDASNIALTGTGAVLLDEGLITDLGGSTRLGNTGSDDTTLSIAAGGTYDILGNNNLGANGTAVIDNAGLLEKTDSRGQSNIYPGLTNTGTLLVASGTLDLVGASQLGGSIAGAGELILSSGLMTLAPGASINVGTLVLLGGDTFQLAGNLDYAGRLFADGGSTISLHGDDLTLDNPAGNSVNGVVLGPGTLNVAGTLDDANMTVTGGAVVRVAGVLTQSSNVQLGTGTADAATLDVIAGGTYDIITDNQIGASGTAAIDNAGLFEKTGNIGQSNIYAPIFNTGTIAAGLGLLALQSSLENDALVTADATLFVAGAVTAGSGQSGTFAIGEGGTVEFAGAVAAAETVAFGAGGGDLELQHPGSFAGTITGFGSADTIDLLGTAANTFTLNGDNLALFDVVNGNTTTIATLAVTGISDASSIDLAIDPAGNGTAITFGRAGTVFATPTASTTNNSWTASSGSWTTCGRLERGAARLAGQRVPAADRHRHLRHHRHRQLFADRRQPVAERDRRQSDGR